MSMSFDQGPDQLMPADDFVTLSADGVVKLRVEETGDLTKTFLNADRARIE
jgi:hypothetical protein